MKKVYMSCHVAGCHNTHNKSPPQRNVSYFSVPSDPNMRAIWLEKMQLLEEHRDDSFRFYVCEKHFERTYINDNYKCKRLLRRAIPTLHMPRSDTVIGSLELDTSVASTSTDTKRQLDEPEHHSTNKLIKIKEEPEYLTLFKDDYDEREEVLILNQIEFVPMAEDVPKVCVQKSKPQKRKYSYEFKMTALNMYFDSPFSYRALQKSFKLPRISTLYRLCIPETTALNHYILTALKIKGDSMTQAQKQCVICIGSMSLRPHVYYDFKADKISGFHEVDGVQILEPAGTVLIVMVRGLFHKWKQAISFSFLSNFQNYKDVNGFIEDIISRLFSLGFKVRALMTDSKTEKFTGGKEESLNAESPFISIDNNKIYYIYETLYLMKDLRDHLMTHNFLFCNGSLAQWQHINDCYNHDLKRQALRVAPKLALEHIMPVRDAVDDLKRTADLFDKATATAISVYVDMKLLDPSAIYTAQWIVTMNKLMELLNFSTIYPPENKSILFSGEASQVEFLVGMVSLFSDLRFFPTSPIHSTSSSTFVEAARITISAILLLCESLKSENCWHPIVGLSRDYIDDFFHKVHRECGTNKPTTKQIIMYISKFPIFNIFTYLPKKRRSNDLETLMSLARQMSDIAKYEQSSDEVRVDIGTEEKKEFRKVQLQKNNGLEQLCLYLLHKGYEQHNDCVIMKTYVWGAEPANYNLAQVTNASLKINLTDCDVPIKFKEFIVSLERKFKQYFRENRLTRSLAGLESSMISIKFDMPCDCFPLDYVKKMYLRFRLHLVLDYNNKLIKSNYNNCKTAFIVNDL